MKTLLRMLAITAGTVGALLVALLLVLAFSDLSRFKGRIESYVTASIGRPFAIDGRLSIDVFPALKVEAENVRVGNTPWGSAPQLLQVGRFATEIDLWSLLSGPVNVHTLELRNVALQLEKNSKGEKNWVFGEQSEDDSAVDGTSSGFTRLSVAIQKAIISNLAVTYRAPGAPARIATVANLTLQPDADNMLVLDGSGSVEGYKADIAGRVGPLESLLSGRSIRLDLTGGLGDLRLATRGGFGRLNPLDGADLIVSVEHPDLETFLRNVRLPVIATGSLDIKVSLKDAGDRTELGLTAQAGDLSLRTTGKLATLGLRDSDLMVTAGAGDAARVASVFGIKGVPAGKLAVAGHVVTTATQYRLDRVHASLGEYEARADGTLPAKRGGNAKLRLELALPSLADLKAKLPALPLKVAGTVAYRAATKERVGSLASLLAARDIRLDLAGEFGATQITVKGGIGRLHPLDQADLSLSAKNPDAGTILQKLHLPAIATGQINIDARLKDAGNLTDVDFTARAGDLSLHAAGKLSAPSLRGSDLTFEGGAGDAARLASAFDIKGVPDGRLVVTGHVVTSDTEYRLDGVHATLGDYETHVDGMIPRQRDSATSLRFDAAIPSLVILRASLPPLPFKVSGEVAMQPGNFVFRNLVARFGESHVQGSVTVTGTKDREIEADLDAPLLDVTPFLADKLAVPAKPAPKAGSRAEERRYLFGEQRIPVEKLGHRRVNLHLTSAEVRLSRGVLHGVDTTLALDNGRLQARFQAHGSYGGSINGSIDLAPAGDGSSAIKLDADLQNVRAGFAGGESVTPMETPPINLKVSLASSGATPRQLASAASGSLLLTQGPGKSKNGLLNLIGNDIINQLLGKLNPFSDQDPYTQIECTVARMEITDGKAMVAPVLMQTGKVAVRASGTIDLKTEKLLLNFNTQPRKGIGISPGMFTNPFLDLTGTLAHPSIGLGGKGVTSGAIAVATGGISVLAKGALDRAMGATDQCKEALEKANLPPGNGRSRSKEGKGTDKP